MKLYVWTVDKIVWLLVCTFCAIAGTVIGECLTILIQEVTRE